MRLSQYGSPSPGERKCQLLASVAPDVGFSALRRPTSLSSVAHQAVAATTESLSGAGSTFSAPLLKQWIKVYQSEHPSVSITYDVVGSGEGVSRFIAGSVDFGASDEVLSDSEIAKVSQGVVMVPATAGMVVLAYNMPDLHGKLRLPRDVYPGIFSGAIRHWDDPRLQKANPGLTLPHRDIAIAARLDSSGTTAAFTSHLAAIDPKWRAQGLGVGKLIEWPAATMYGRGNEGVASLIKISQGSIGYVEYGFAKRLGLPMAVLQNEAGAFVEPSPAAGHQAHCRSRRVTQNAGGPGPIDHRSGGSWCLSHRHVQLAASL